MVSYDSRDVEAGSVEGSSEHLWCVDLVMLTLIEADMSVFSEKQNFDKVGSGLAGHSEEVAERRLICFCGSTVFSALKPSGIVCIRVLLGCLFALNLICFIFST